MAPKRKEIDELYNRNRVLELSMTEMAGNVSGLTKVIADLKDMFTNHVRSEEEEYKLLMKNSNDNTLRITALERNQEDAEEKRLAHEEATNESIKTLTKSNTKFQNIMYWVMGIGAAFAFMGLVVMGALDVYSAAKEKELHSKPQVTVTTPAHKFSERDNIWYYQKRDKENKTIDRMNEFLLKEGY